MFAAQTPIREGKQQKRGSKRLRVRGMRREGVNKDNYIQLMQPSSTIFKRTLAEVASCGREGVAENNNGRRNSRPRAPSSWRHRLNGLHDALFPDEWRPSGGGSHNTTNLTPWADSLIRQDISSRKCIIYVLKFMEGQGEEICQEFHLREAVYSGTP